MCEYCEYGNAIRSYNWNGSGYLNIGKNGNLYAKDDEIFKINYCPMCGRKLV